MQFALFSDHQPLVYGFSTRSDGSMNRFTCVPNRHRYFTRRGLDPERVVTADLVHGTEVSQVSAALGGTIAPHTDALVTNATDTYLSVTGADCFPLFFCDPIHHAVGIAHAGWRGAVGNIVANTVAAMQREYGTMPSDLLCGIGPGIRRCHFSIKPEDAGRYDTYTPYLVERNGQWFADLPGIIREQLIAAGLTTEHIEDSEVCTYCNAQDYFSYRRDRPDELELMFGHFGITSK
jgi:hypothetical protein